MTKSEILEYYVVNTLTKSHKEQLLKLFDGQWWTKHRTSEDVEKIIKGSSLVFGLINKKDDLLIGFTRVLSDFFKYAYIYDLMVSSDYRNLGYGKLLVKMILEHPLLKEIKYFELTCLTEMTKFYENYGFSLDYGNDVVAMRYRNKDSVNS